MASRPARWVPHSTCRPDRSPGQYRHPRSKALRRPVPRTKPAPARKPRCCRSCWRPCSWPETRRQLQTHVNNYGKFKCEEPQRAILTASAGWNWTSLPAVGVSACRNGGWVEITEGNARSAQSLGFLSASWMWPHPGEEEQQQEGDCRRHVMASGGNCSECSVHSGATGRGPRWHTWRWPGDGHRGDACGTEGARACRRRRACGRSARPWRPRACPPAPRQHGQ